MIIKHKNEFPNIQNSKQYVDHATQFINNPPSGTLKLLPPFLNKKVEVQTR